MNMDIRETCRKHGISPSAYYQRIHRGWTPQAASTTPIGRSTYHYVIICPDGSNKTCKSTREVAKYLTGKLRYTVTKNVIVGQIYRKGFASVDKYEIERVEVWKQKKKQKDIF